MSIKNIDGMLMSDQADMDTNAKEEIKTENLDNHEAETPVNIEVSHENDDNVSRETLSDNDDEVVDETDDETDEYGNSVPKPVEKMYSEEEVQRMIRERLARGQHGQQAQQEAQKEQFQYDENAEGTWEQQLETFVEKTLEKVTKKQADKQWQANETKKQQEFEDKFTTGMGKYKDFVAVVASQPITNAMMMATRSMKDPAAFIYAASKQHPKEIERIAQIPDAYQQSAEIGRLEERMRKARAVTKTPKPLSKNSSDVSDKVNPRRAIDDLIRLDAKKRLVRR